MQEFQHTEYDQTEPSDAAILLCAQLVQAAVEALNTAHNEHTVPWEQNRASIIAGVRRTLDNPNESPEANHNAWHDYKRAEGWAYGLTKDAVAKTHPCLVPYASLGPFQQSKDAIFQAIVRTFFGLEVTAPVVVNDRGGNYDAPQLLAELDAYVVANFTSNRIGEPRATIDGKPGGVPYITYHVGAEQTEDHTWWSEVADYMIIVLRDLKAAGAVEIVWRLAGRFQAGVGTGYEVDALVASVRTRFAALDKDGKEVRLNKDRETAEGMLLTRLDTKEVQS